MAKNTASGITSGTERNGLIELLRFIFAFIVLMVHTHGLRVENPTDYPFAGGYIAVEFFLILSGFFCSKYCFERKTDILPGKLALSFTLRQLSKLIIPVIVSVVIHYVIAVIFGNFDPSELPYAIYEILLLPQSGIYKTFLNLPLWYLSAYMICLPVLIYFLNKSSDFFFNIGVVIFPLLIYGYICRTNIHVDIWSFDSQMFIGLLRISAGLCMGVNSYKIHRAFSELKIKKSFRKVIYIAAFASIATVIIYCYKFAFTYADYFLILLMTFSIGVISEINTPQLNNNRFISFLGKWSIYLYCSHWTIRFILPVVFENLKYNELLPIYISVSLIYSLVIFLISKIIHYLFKKIKKQVII